MEQKCLNGEEGFDADESPPTLVNNYEQHKYEFMIEIDDMYLKLKNVQKNLIW